MTHRTILFIPHDSKLLDGDVGGAQLPKAYKCACGEWHVTSCTMYCATGDMYSHQAKVRALLLAHEGRSLERWWLETLAQASNDDGRSYYAARAALCMDVDDLLTNPTPTPWLDRLGHVVVVEDGKEIP